MDLKSMIKRRSFSNGNSAETMRGGKEKAEDEEVSDRKEFQRKNQKKIKKEKFECRLVKYEALPEYLKDNEYILDYYRSEWPLKEAFLSVFSWHNETLNIWTHLGGFLIFVALTVLSSMDSPELRALVSGSSRNRNIQEPFMMKMMMKNISGNLIGLHVPQSSSLVNLVDRTGGSDTIPRWPWFVFLVGSMGCLICSSFSHLLACHSQTFNFFFWRLDYAGISLMIVSSFFPPIYYAFFCNSLAKIFYLSSISILGILAIITLLAPSLSSPRFRRFRACLFLTMGFSGLIPAAHAIILNWGHPQIIVALAYELTMAVLYAAGVAFYVGRIPERWKPGAFDIAGHSHQIFHLFVVAGALAHYAATMVLLDWREISPSCESGSSILSWT